MRAYIHIEKKTYLCKTLHYYNGMRSDYNNNIQNKARNKKTEI